MAWQQRGAALGLLALTTQIGFPACSGEADGVATGGVASTTGGRASGGAGGNALTGGRVTSGGATPATTGGSSPETGGDAGAGGNAGNGELGGMNQVAGGAGQGNKTAGKSTGGENGGAGQGGAAGSSCVLGEDGEAAVSACTLNDVCTASGACGIPSFGFPCTECATGFRECACTCTVRQQRCGDDCAELGQCITDCVFGNC